LLEQIASRGVYVPAIATRVEVEPHLLVEWRAYFELAGDRPVQFVPIGGEMGATADIRVLPGPIPWTAVDAYGRRLELTGDAFDRFAALLAAMDRAYLDWKAEVANGRTH